MRCAPPVERTLKAILIGPLLMQPAGAFDELVDGLHGGFQLSSGRIVFVTPGNW
jgi:hypothetical protein